MNAHETQEHDLSLSEIRDAFRARNLRCTRQREVLYGALMRTDSHPTAEELHHLAGGNTHGISLATVYNTLEVFTTSGLARRIACPAGNGANRYDAKVAPHVHVRLADGNIVDVPPELGAKLLNSLPKDVVAEVGSVLGVDIDTISIELGVCELVHPHPHQGAHTHDQN